MLYQKLLGKGIESNLEPIELDYQYKVFSKKNTRIKKNSLGILKD